LASFSLIDSIEFVPIIEKVVSEFSWLNLNLSNSSKTSKNWDSMQGKEDGELTYIKNCLPLSIFFIFTKVDAYNML
jgi:hypothetical protein